MTVAGSQPQKQSRAVCTWLQPREDGTASSEDGRGRRAGMVIKVAPSVPPSVRVRQPCGTPQQGGAYLMRIRRREKENEYREGSDLFKM